MLRAAGEPDQLVPGGPFAGQLDPDCERRVRWCRGEERGPVLRLAPQVMEPVPHALVELRANLVLVPTLSFKMDAFRAAASDTRAC